jgi:hypothetical protein
MVNLALQHWLEDHEGAPRSPSLAVRLHEIRGPRHRSRDIRAAKLTCDQMLTPTVF